MTMTKDENGNTIFKDIGSFDPPKPPRQEVRCPEHDIVMTYHPEDDSMRCRATGCDYVSVRFPAFADFWEVDGVGQMQVYKGRLTLVQDDRGAIYLHLEDINGLVDVTNLIQRTLDPDIPGRHDKDGE